ncbi:MAG: class I SAM-dependent methyltransferase [Actinobacteria bacterium]|nr:class I SAM-dependent methyltransferase [Actinomycetota bacterium]MBW3651023.1 class I SAM-dependent methyltransferase [Actinomycetota bacterium]
MPSEERDDPDPVAANRRLWDARTPIHLRSSFYDVEGFLSGRSSLHDLEVEEVGEVDGRSLLHLQCHFGMDTLSWARRGARVTGADFSPVAIKEARRLSAELGIAARFVESDIFRLPRVLEETFDVVFTSYGALCWLPDIARWAEVAAGFVRPGGFLYVVEMHPAAMTLSDEPGIRQLRIGYPYWTGGEPLRFEEEGTYADYDAPIKLPEYVWNHGLGEIVTALIDAGLVLEFLHEHDCTIYQQLPFMKRGPDGWWRLPSTMPALPLLFSLRARRVG